MFNRSYQLRAVRDAGGGHQVAEAFYRPKPLPSPSDAASGLACARQGVNSEPGHPGVAPSGKTTESVVYGEFDPELQPITARKTPAGCRACNSNYSRKLSRQSPRESAANSNFPDLASTEVPMTEDELEAHFLKSFPL
jgi:hypothetical protein